MGRRAATFLTGAVIITAVLLLPPRATLDAAGLAFAALPWAALGLTVAFPGVVWSHAVFPASFAPLAIARPDVFGPERHAGLGGLLTVIVVIAAFGLLIQASSARTDGGTEDAPARVTARPQIARLLALFAICAPAAGVWEPLLSGPPRPAALALGVIATLAVGLVAAGPLMSLAPEATVTDARAAEMTLRASLRRGSRRIPLGVALGVLTGLAGLAWYLRLGGAG
jgi:hypothetical protein